MYGAQFNFFSSYNDILSNEQKPSQSKIEGGTLYLFEGAAIHEMEPQEFWLQVGASLQNPQWATLFLAPGVTISREVLQAYVQLKFEIPPTDLIVLNEALPLIKPCFPEKGTQFIALGSDGKSALKMALRKGNLEMVTLLLKHGAEITWKDLTYAAYSENPALLQILFDHAPNVPKTEIFGHLNEETFSDDENAVELFTGLFSNKNFDINMCDEKGTPFLHLIFELYEPELYNPCLLHPSLNKNLENADKLTILQFAVTKCDTDFVKLLLENGVDVNAKVSSQRTPLHIAVKQGDEKMILLLLKNKADVEVKDRHGLLPLHYAIHHNGYAEALIAILAPQNMDLTFDEEDICLAHKQGRLPYLGDLYEQVDESQQLYTKECNQLKLCAHAFEIEKKSRLTLRKNWNKSKVIDLEGMHHDRWLHRKIGKQLKHLEYEPLFPSATREMLSDACKFSELSASKSNAEFLQRIHEGKPTLLFSGYHKHAIQIVFRKINNNMIVCGIVDRQNPLKLFGIDPKKLTTELISNIRNSGARPKENYDLVRLSLDQLSFSTPLTKQIENEYPLEEQKVGNCVFASLEGALWTLIALQHEGEQNGLERATELFSFLQLNAKIQFTKKYFLSHLSGISPYFPDMELCRRMMEQVGHYSKKLRSLYDELKELSINFLRSSVDESPKNQSA